MKEFLKEIELTKSKNKRLVFFNMRKERTKVIEIVRKNERHKEGN